MTATLSKKLDSWQRELLKALSSGKGKYRDYIVRDVWDYINLIGAIKYRGPFGPRRIQNLLYTFGSLQREKIPRSIYNFLSDNGFNL